MSIPLKINSLSLQRAGPDVIGVHARGDPFSDVLPIGVRRFRAQQVGPARFSCHLHRILMFEENKNHHYSALHFEPGRIFHCVKVYSSAINKLSVEHGHHTRRGVV